MLLTILSGKFAALFLLYTDPGSGALLLQILIAGLLGGVFYLRRFKEKIFRAFGSKKADSDKLPENVN
jgi:hypothetical protein